MSTQFEPGVGSRGPDPRKLFVIHGRNDAAREAIFTFLRSIGLEPIEWIEALRMTGQGSPYIGDVLDAAFANAQAVVVLQTPDDIAYLDSRLCEPGDPELEPQPQPRPNVLYEAGMAMGRNPNRTVIVEFGKVKAFSDIHGRHVVRLDNSVRRRQEFADRLRTAGCAVNLDGTDWHTVGDLTPPPEPGGGLPMGKKTPRSQSPAQPRLKARYIHRGKNSLGDIEVTNYGPGDVYALNLEEPDYPRGEYLRHTGNLPIDRLPAGESVIAADYLGNIWAGSNRSHTTLVATGQTEDGYPIRQELFVSLGA